MPLNIFEERYLSLVNDALRSDRMIGIIQPEENTGLELPKLYQVGCLGRLTQFNETGDGRYLISLTGIARFQVMEEIDVSTPYRQCRVNYEPFRNDFVPRSGEEDVDRAALLKALKLFSKANDLKVDWKGVQGAPNEALVNALSMMAPFGPREKQALLEAADLKTRADVLVAITEIELARNGFGNGEGTLQ